MTIRYDLDWASWSLQHRYSARSETLPGIVQFRSDVWLEGPGRPASLCTSEAQLPLVQDFAGAGEEKRISLRRAERYTQEFQYGVPKGTACPDRRLSTATARQKNYMGIKPSMDFL